MQVVKKILFVTDTAKLTVPSQERQKLGFYHRGGRHTTSSLPPDGMYGRTDKTIL